ncbi:MAG: hypothetical protein GXP25_08190 [Planctomycetes bacterium]|nr:hypothetical protein [Planctomycetota bacterium]
MSRRIGVLASVVICLVGFGCAYTVEHTTSVTNMRRMTKRKVAEFQPDASAATNEIVFVGQAVKEEGRKNNLDIWRISASSPTEIVRVTDHEADDLNPAYSTDGRTVAFDSPRVYTDAVWEKASTGAGAVRQISEDGELSFGDPDVDEQGFVYVAFDSAMRWPGTHPVEIDDVGRAIGRCLVLPVELLCKGFEFTLKNIICGQPYVDEDTILCRYDRNGYLWLCDYDGKNATEFVEGLCPQISPDGQRIVFHKINADEEADIWVVDRDGRNLTQITTHPLNDIEPSWSPSGDRIAFASNRASSWLQRLLGDWNYDIWVMNADGTGMMQLTMDSKYEGHPCWGSDEDIYFHTYGGWWIFRNWDIWGMTLAR